MPIAGRLPGDHEEGGHPWPGEWRQAGALPDLPFLVTCYGQAMTAPAALAQFAVAPSGRATV